MTMTNKALQMMTQQQQQQELAVQQLVQQLLQLLSLLLLQPADRAAAEACRGNPVAVIASEVAASYRMSRL
jgi:hypothetical protein